LGAYDVTSSLNIRKLPDSLVSLRSQKYDSLMVKITKLFALPKFGSLKGSTSASLKIGEISAIRKNLASF